MLAEGLKVTVYGMGGVFLFLLFLVSLMYAQAGIFKYLKISDKSAQSEQDNADEEMVAAAIALKLKNG
ncbi:MAG: hypothetical protein MJ247_02160 [Alphaproteobacteria bacterium]|nr:hypothetical protein [Alphaproteobacteria bacterium]